MNAGRTPRWPIHLGMTATLILLVCPPAEGAGTEVPLRSPVAQQKKLTAADAGGGDHFGSSTAIDGARMVVSANHDGGGDSGSAYIFERDSGGAENWGQVKKLTAADAEAWAVFGVSVAIEGSTVVIGSPWKNATAADSGAAYVFERDFGGPGNWGQVKRLTAADAAAWDLFGMSVAISGSTVVVGCRFDDDAGSESGSAYIFERDFGGPGNWGQVKKLTAADAAAADEFGTWLAIDGSTVVVGSFHDDDAGTDSGSAYVFERDFGGPDNWGQVKKLVAADAAAGDRFGNSVAIAGSTVLIGAPANDAAGTDSGSVYVFERDFGGPGNWGQVKQLTAADAGASDFFGSRVACTDSMVVTAAQLDDDGGADSGAAYVFARNVGGADNWGQVQKLTAADAGAGDLFGYAVTISGPTVVVGAPYDDDGAGDAGAAYVFRQTVDLEVSATESIDPVIAGSGAGNLTYTVTVQNNGPEDAAGVALSEDLTLPPGVSVASITPSGTTTFATTTAPDGLWTVGNLAAGSSETLTVALTAGSSTAAGSDVVGSTATVTSAYGVDTDTGNDSATLATSVVLQADLGITKTDGAVSAVPGESLVYTIVASNPGPSDAAPVAVADTFPAALTSSFSSVAAGGATGNTSGSGNLSETLAMPAASSVTWTVTCTIDSGATGTLSNTAAISSAVTDPVPGNNSATDNDTVLVPETDLEITQSDAPDPVVAGTSVTYALTAANQGPSDATGVVVTDTLPPEVSFVSASPGCTAAGGVVTCTAGNLAAGAGTAFAITATVDSAVTGAITNTAVVTGNETDPNPLNTAAETTTVVAETDLTVTKSDSPDPVVAGTGLSYTLTGTNQGPSDATGVVVTDTLPPEVSFVSASPGCTAAGGVVTCTAGNLAAGVSTAFTITATVDSAVTGTITNTAGVTGNETDPNLPNTVAETTAVVAETDLTVTKSDSPDPVVAGTGLSYTLTVANQGPSDATGVVATDTLPPEVSFVSASPGCTAAGGVVTCTVGALAAGGSAALTITATVDSAVTGTITNTAGVTGNETDPNLPNTATETTAVVAETDLTVTKSDSPDPVVAGTGLSYTLTVVNQGPSDATGVVMTDSLPAGVRLVSSSSGCTAAGRVVICTAGELAAGASAEFTIGVTVDPAAAGTITNTADVTGNETDPNLPNTVAEPTTIVAETDLAIAKSVATDPVAAGSNLTWTLQVSNHGPSTATGVVAVDALPPGVSLVSASPDCTAVEDLVTCTAGELAVGAGADFTLEVMVDPATGSITNTADVTGNETDPAAGNNRAVATAAVVLPADLVLSQSDSADPVLPGDELTWTVTVTNHGPADAEDVVVTDVLPQGVALVATSGCAEDPAGTPVCTLGTIPAGESRSYELTVTVDPGVAGTLLHPADASSAVAEAQPGDESSTETTEVTGEADLAVELSGPTTAVPGGEVHYTLTVTNLGPDEVVGAQVQDFFAPELVGVSWSLLPQALALATLGQGSGVLDDPVDLAAGAAVTYEITATVAAEATDTVGHSAFVQSGGVADPNPVNDAAATSAELRPAADLQLMLENGRAELIPDKTIAYTVTVSNPGPSDSPTVRLTGSFPLTEATVICTDCDKSVETAELDETFAVPAGGGVTWVVAGTVPADAEGMLVSEAALELPADFDDPDPSNNQMTDVDTVIPGEVAPLGPPRRLAEGGNPAVVFSDSGRSLVVFEQGEAGGSKMIRGLEIDASGVPGNDFPMSIDIGLNPAVDLDAELDPEALGASKQGRGAYLTVWQEEMEPSAVVGQLSRDGRPLGSAMGLSTRPTSQVRPDVLRSTAGGFLVVWESTGSDADEEGIFGRFVDPAGQPVDDVELRLNRETGRTPQRPALASDGSRFLVVWDSPTSGGERRIAGQRLTPAGGLAGPALELSDGAGSQTDPAVAFDDSSGRYLVVWRQQEGAGGGIAGRVFDPAARPQGEEFLIGTEGDSNPEVSSEEGNFTVVWERPLGPRSATFGQLIDPEGRPVGSEFRVSGSAGKGFNDEETGFARPAVAYAPHGAIVEAGEADVFAVIWGDRTAADEQELNGQRYAVTADLLLAVFDDPDPLPPGASALVYTVVVQNLSTADADDVVVIHRLPAGVTLVFSQGCAEDPSAAEICTLGTVEGGGLRQYVLETRVAPGVQGTLPLPATVSSSTPDPDQSDNVADELTRFGVADLEVELSAGNVSAGERARWRLVVTNAGPSLAGGTALAVDLPLGVSVVASNGCGEDPSATETCTLGTLAAGAERRVELEVEFARTLTGTVTPSVSVASGVYDPDLASNVDTAAIEVLGSALEVGIEAPARVAPGGRFPYAVSVRNAGGSELGDVEVRAALPAGLRLVATRGCAEDPAGMPVCTLGMLAGGEVREMELTVDVDEGLRGIVRFGVNVAAPSAASLAVASAETAVGEAEVLELVDGRFAVQVEFRNQHAGGATGAGQTVPYSDNTGFFYFFDPNNLELLVKVLDGGAINGHFWFFYGALTDLEYDVTVTDRVTGAGRTYHNPPGEICGQGDTAAFPWSEDKQQGSVEGWQGQTSLEGWQGQTSLEGWQGHPSLEGWQGQTTPTVARTTSRPVQVPQASDVKRFALVCPGKQQGFLEGWQGQTTPTVARTTSRPVQVPQASDVKRFALVCPGKQQGQGVPAAAGGGISSHHHRPGELSQALPLPPLDKCTPGAEALCLSGGRFQVEVTWRNQHAGGVEGSGRAVAGTGDSGYFWFFDADNLELAVKLLDGRGVNGRFWFFYGGLSDVEYWITVTDTETGESRMYHNPPGEICGGADVSAF